MQAKQMRLSENKKKQEQIKKLMKHVPSDELHMMHK